MFKSESKQVGTRQHTQHAWITLDLGKLMDVNWIV